VSAVSPIKLSASGPGFAAELRGLDLSQAYVPGVTEALRTALHDHGVLVIRNSGLTDETHIGFSRALGELDQRTGFGLARNRLAHRELFDASNLDEEGRLLPDDHRRRLYNLGNQLWHTDSSFKQRRAAYSALRGHEVPQSGGDTEFVDLRVAYEALSEAARARLNGLQVEHSLWHSRMSAGFPEPTAEERHRMPPVRHPLVHLHASGRRALYMGAHASHIVGWDVPSGRALLRELLDIATRLEGVYRHRWQPNDLVIWDNLCTLHRATEFDDMTVRRDMRRTTVHEPLRP